MLPLAMLLGIGCKKNVAEPEVMALYGGPPVEEPVEVPSSTEEPEETDKSESDDSQTSVETSSEQSNDSEIETVEEIRPEREIMALYGAPPMEPIRVESLEQSKDDATESEDETPSED
jgi:hypothetical protein